MLSPGKLLSVSSVTLWLVSCFVTQAHAGPTYPQWWIDQGVIENDVLPPTAPGETGYDQATYDAWMAENYNAALLGQAKNLAKAAFNEMETAQAGSAGTEITNMVNGFSTAYEDNYTPILLGQLKEMVRPFYQVMDDANFTITLSDGTVISNQSYRFPWPEPPLLPSDPAYDPGNPTHVSAYEAWLPQHYQAALLGQVKHVFSFSLASWPPNLIPIVDAGDDFELLLPIGSYTLAGNAIDNDGPQTLTYLWTQVSGPGTATFDDATLTNATVTFPVAGTYVLKLEADDSEAVGEDEVTISVKADVDGNGIADEIDTAWAAVIANDPNFVSTVNADFYDPDGTIEGDPLDPNDNLVFLPVAPTDTDGLSSLQWDYDGDGISNYQEYLDGTSPTDYFNGATPVLRVFVGDGQTAAPDSFVKKRIYVKAEESDGTDYINAPVKFTTGSYSGLSAIKDNTTLVASLVNRTDAYGAWTEYYAPTAIGSSTIIASLPDSQSVTITIHTVDAASAAKPSISNFVKTEHADGSRTYTWTSHAVQGDWFQIESQQADGTWLAIYQTTYGSANLPYVSGVTDYTLTLDVNDQPVL